MWGTISCKFCDIPRYKNPALIFVCFTTRHFLLVLKMFGDRRCLGGILYHTFDFMVRVDFAIASNTNNQGVWWWWLMMSRSIFNIVKLISLYYFSVCFISTFLWVSMFTKVRTNFIYTQTNTKSAANYVKSVYCVYFVVELKFAV